MAAPRRQPGEYQLVIDGVLHLDARSYADRRGVTVNRVNALIKQGRIPTVDRLGRRWIPAGFVWQRLTGGPRKG